ncbi:MAG: DUF4062 domain-containing protein [Bacteroidota bacterium]
MNEKPVVMISSTVKDLPAYRSQVQDACLRTDTFPKMMEHLPAVDADAIEVSLKMVDESDIYIGIFAHKYGYIPEGHEISITEMEYRRAVERGIPILAFIIDDEVPVKPKDFERGAAAEKLEKLKNQLKRKVVGSFTSPEDLRSLVIQSLSRTKKQLQAAEKEPINQGEALANSLHALTEIPTKPEPFIAHPYTLLQLKGLIGRKKELELLTDWITKAHYEDLTIFNIVAIGGMGKSALTWTWFNQIAPQEKEWTGRVWWSFYETDATFDNFITKTLAYVSGKPLKEVKNLSTTEKQDTLFRILNTQPYLIVFDGLERILVAYARKDAAFLDDDNALDELTANRIADAYGLPESSAKSYIGKHRLRKTTDSRTGHFLRKLSQVRKSKILVSTRLYPADLQNNVGQPYPGCNALFLNGLSDQDALELWRAYGAKGSRETMLPVFRSFDKHPLLLQLLASEIAEYRTAPGDFDAWQKANPEFNVFGLPLVQVQSHVLSYALKGLSIAELRTLQVIAGFRMPASMMTLKALLLEKQEEEETAPIFSSEAALDQALTILEDKGLLGWDRRTNRYDLHPIVRGVVWNNLDADKQYEIHGSLRTHFEAMPTVEDWTQVEGIEDLRPAIELYNALIEMKLYDEAAVVFYNKIDDATLYRLSASHLRVELLERLFVHGVEQLPPLSSEARQSWTLDSLGLGYLYSGMPGKATSLFERGKEQDLKINDQKNLAITLSNLSEALQLTGQLFRAELAARKGLILSREIEEYDPKIYNLRLLWGVQTNRGRYDKAKKVLMLLIRLSLDDNHKQSVCVAKALLSQTLLLDGEHQLAKDLANEAWQLAAHRRLKRDFIRAAYCQGLAALRLNDMDTADERLHHALRRVRAVQAVDEELQILNALAEFYHEKDEPAKAKEYLDEVWDRAEQGPYPLLHADALNILAQIERDAGNPKAAIAAAMEAYQKAWCDGPPYAYHYGLQKAKGLLQELGAEEPELPPFDPSQFEPMPEVEIDPEEIL